MKKSSHIQHTAWIMVFLGTITLIAGSAFCQVTLEAAKGAPTTVPATINYQGRLLASDGKPLSGDHALSIKIYTQETEGNAVWGPQLFAAVPVVNGHFNIILGPTDTNGKALADTFTTNPDTWLQVTVDNNPIPILTRQKILSVPYAVQAEKADKLTGPCNCAESCYSSSYNNGGKSWKIVPDISITLTTSGRPVLLTLSSNGDGPDNWISRTSASRIRLVRDASGQICSWTNANMEQSLPLSLTYLETDVPAGTHTYTISMYSESESGTYEISRFCLKACEL